MVPTKPTIKGFSNRKQGYGALVDGVYIIDGKRTPFGKLSGALSTMTPTDLAILSAKAALEAAKIPAAEIDHTITANIGPASADSFFSPRHIGLYAGVPIDVPALLVQRICGSGIEVLAQASRQITAHESVAVLCSGTEVMSRFPVASFTARQGFVLGKPGFIDFLWEALDDTAAIPMGATADKLASRYAVTRQEADAFALESQNRYAKAFEEGFFKNEIVPVPKSGVFEAEGLKPRKFRASSEGLSADEYPRKTTLEKLASLSPVFTQNGVTTAGNASGICDGAASAIVASGEFVATHGLKVLGKILGYASCGVSPEIMGIGPAPAIRTLLANLKMNLSDIDLFEINEAFAAQCVSVQKELGISREVLNVHGGAVAIGHPLATTGIRLAITALHALYRAKKQRAVISACIGGGQGIAMVLEVVS